MAKCWKLSLPCFVGALLCFVWGGLLSLDHQWGMWLVFLVVQTVLVMCGTAIRITVHEDYCKK